MENYYTEIIDEIKTALEKGEIEEAEYLLKKELSMPYIPQEIEVEFSKLRKEKTNGTFDYVSYDGTYG